MPYRQELDCRRLANALTIDDLDAALLLRKRQMVTPYPQQTATLTSHPLTLIRKHSPSSPPMLAHRRWSAPAFPGFAYAPPRRWPDSLAPFFGSIKLLRRPTLSPHLRSQTPAPDLRSNKSTVISFEASHSAQQSTVNTNNNRQHKQQPSTQTTTVKMKVTTIIATLFFGIAVMAAPRAVSLPHHAARCLLLLAPPSLPVTDPSQISLKRSFTYAATSDDAATAGEQKACIECPCSVSSPPHSFLVPGRGSNRYNRKSLYMLTASS
jgi:hypothetical protein